MPLFVAGKRDICSFSPDRTSSGQLGRMAAQVPDSLFFIGCDKCLLSKRFFVSDTELSTEIPDKYRAGRLAFEASGLYLHNAGFSVRSIYGIKTGFYVRRFFTYDPFFRYSAASGRIIYRFFFTIFSDPDRI